MNTLNTVAGGPGERRLPELRDLLFGDMPMERWVGNGSLLQPLPWNAFASARADFARGDRETAVKKWEWIARRPALEARHYLQAWHFLRGAGSEPAPEIANQLLGIVVEVGMDRGVDYLAAYTDHSVRYYNSSGKSVFWEHGSESMNPWIDPLLAAGRRVVLQIGPWRSARPPAPPKNRVRLNFLTPSGLHFGEAPLNEMANDPVGSEVLYRAGQLMQALIEVRQAPAA